MSRKEIIASLKKHNGTLTNVDKGFDGVIYSHVAKFDSGLDSEEWSDETGLGGPSDFVGGIFHTWFNGGIFK